MSSVAPDRVQAAAELVEDLRASGVELVRISYPDLHGICRSKDVPIAAAEHALEHGMAQTEAIMTVDLGHNVVAGFEHGFRDYREVPDLATMVRHPEDPTVAWCLADGVSAEGEPFPLDPRGALKRAIAGLDALGYEPIAGPEYEFYLVEPGTWRPYVGHDSSVYTCGAVADPAGILREIVRCAGALGLLPTFATQEYGRGQYEVNLLHGPALDASDRAFRLKALCKDVASRHGLLATFMGQISDDEGSGFHLHVSLADSAGENAFAAPDGEHGISDVARRFAAGILAHMPALTAFLNPTVNAYRRFVVESLAPTHVNWGLENRLALLRIPDERGDSTRIEVRSGDGTANPYLVIAAMLNAGRDGIERELDLPGPPVEGNPYENDEAALGQPLPNSLDQTLAALEADSWLRDAMGPELVDTFVLIKRYELDRWNAELAKVTEWERREYAHHL
jgi:glutamine synthetase